MGRVARAVKAIDFIPIDGGFGTMTATDSIRASITGPIFEGSALQVTAIYAAVKVLSETLASLPLLVYQRLPGGGKDRAQDHPAYRVLHDRANPEMTSYIWRETAMSHLATWGNSYNERVENGLGELVEIWPLRPDRIQVKRDDAGRRVYWYLNRDGTRTQIPNAKMLHIPGLSFDGLVGYSPIALLRQSLAISQAAEEYGARVFVNDARPGAVVIHPKTLSDTARTNLRNSITLNHAGSKNAGKVMLLEEDMKFETIGFPPEDAQFIETRKFQLEEIARAYRIPLHLLGDLDKATFSNIEHQSLEFVKYTMLPWLTRWEQQLLDLVDPDHEGVFFPEFLVDGLLRGDAISRATALSIQRYGGALNQDEWRAYENRNPLPDKLGLDFLRPLASAVVGAPEPTADKVNAAGVLVRSGFEPAAALAAVGLDPIRHLGLLPVTVQPGEAA